MSPKARVKGLGKGISALMDDVEIPEPEQAANDLGSEVAIDELRPGKFQPRKHFSDDELKELSESIRRNGLVQPIIVRKIRNGYEIVAGERRWRASKMAGLDKVSVIIRELDDQQTLEFALIENIQRQDLNPLEEAEGYQRLIDDFGHSQDELAEIVGKSRSHVANMLRLLSLPEDVKQHLVERTISMGHARAIIKAENPSALAEEVIRRKLNVRQTENLAAQRDNKAAESATQRGRPVKTAGYFIPTGEKDPDVIALEVSLSDSLGMKVELFTQGERGQIVVSYESLEQLDNALRILGEVA